MTGDQKTGKPEKLTSSTDAARTNRTTKFSDLSTAGCNLANQLLSYVGSEETVVVAIARGGVPLAVEVAKLLRAPLDILLIRRLLSPSGPDSEVCAVNVCGTLVIDPELTLPPAVSKTPLEYFVVDALKGLASRERTCRGERLPLELARKNVLLIDNGIHTGSTMRVAIRALRTMNPSRVVVGVPVAARSSRAAVEAAADHLVCLTWPEPFGHVGLWYSSFNVPDEEQIREMLDQAAPYIESKFHLSRIGGNVGDGRENDGSKFR
jgi:putative phosphoribosyl transferase